MRLGKHNFTKTASIQMGVAILLAVLGVVLGMMTWSDYTIYGKFVSGLRAQAAGRMENALEPLSEISMRRGDYPYPAELDAKLKVDAGSPGSIDKAIDLYRWLGANGHGDRPTVKLGLAAALIRKADLQAEGDRAKLLGDASKSLAGVSWPEAKILRAHLALRQGSVDAAKKDLEAAFNEARRGEALIGLDSMADLYVGLGVCAARNKQYLEASRMFRRANQLMPRARTPLLNSVFLLARQYAETPPPRDELVTTHDLLIRRARESWLREFARDQQTYKGLDRAGLTFVLSVAWAFVVRNEPDPFAFNAIDQANGFSEIPYDRGRRELTIAAACLHQLKRTNLGQGQRNEYRLRAERALEASTRHFADSPKILAQVTYLSAMLGADVVIQEGGRDLNRVRIVSEAFERAAAQDAANPAVHRNRGAFCLQIGQKEKAVAAFEKYLELDKTPSPDQERVREVLAKLKSGG